MPFLAALVDGHYTVHVASEGAAIIVHDWVPTT
jgi:hypothetical protein